MSAQRALTRATSVLLAAGMLSACGEPGTSRDDALPPDAAADQTRTPDADVADVPVMTATAEHGEELFSTVCVACHTMEPPPNLAPPMMAVIGHYRTAFDERDPAVDAMVAYIQAPDPDNSKLGPMAFDRFGTMAPLALPEEDLRAVTGWLWDNYDPAMDPHAEGGPGMRMHQGGKGKGMGRRSP
jgi:hypothetical protein